MSKIAIGFIAALVLMAYRPEVIHFLNKQGIDDRIASLGCEEKKTEQGLTSQ